MIKANDDSNISRADVPPSWPDPPGIMKDCNSKRDLTNAVVQKRASRGRGVRFSRQLKTVHDTEMKDARCYIPCVVCGI